MTRIIYDIGANNGDDIPYYLLKADVVIAIEANPGLQTAMASRFAREISDGRVILENCVVTADAGPAEVDFYLHNVDHVLSQLPPPAEAERELFTRQRLPARSILEIIAAHGDPYYIKIDIEHYDVPLLKALFAAGIRPPFISAEAHSFEVFITLAATGGYRAFKLVDGLSVSERYGDRWIRSPYTTTPQQHSFPLHSAGPFGEDIDGPWLTPESFSRLLALEGLGWKDIHASSCESADPEASPAYVDYLHRILPKQLIQADPDAAAKLIGYVDFYLDKRRLLAYVAQRARRALASRLPRLRR